jgi:hypothetical protein
LAAVKCLQARSDALAIAVLKLAEEALGAGRGLETFGIMKRVFHERVEKAILEIADSKPVLAEELKNVAQQLQRKNASLPDDWVAF